MSTHFFYGNGFVCGRVYSFGGLLASCGGTEGYGQCGEDIMRFSFLLRDGLFGLVSRLISRYCVPSACRYFAIFSPGMQGVTTPTFQSHILRRSLITVVKPLFSERFVRSSCTYQGRGKARFKLCHVGGFLRTTQSGCNGRTPICYLHVSVRECFTDVS